MAGESGQLAPRQHMLVRHGLLVSNSPSYGYVAPDEKGDGSGGEARSST